MAFVMDYLISDAAYSIRYNLGASQIFNHVILATTEIIKLNHRIKTATNGKTKPLNLPSLSQSIVGLYLGCPLSHERPSLSNLPISTFCTVSS